MAPASTGQWQDPDWSAVSSALAGSSRSPFHQPSLHFPSTAPTNSSPHKHISMMGAGVCCFVSQKSDGARNATGQWAPPGQTPGQCPLPAGRHVGVELPGGRHMGLGLSSGLRLLPFPLGCWESGLMAGRPYFARALQPRQKRRRGAPRPALMAPGCPAGVAHTRSRVQNHSSSTVAVRSHLAAVTQFLPLVKRTEKL